MVVNDGLITVQAGGSHVFLLPLKGYLLNIPPQWTVRDSALLIQATNNSVSEQSQLYLKSTFFHVSLPDDPKRSAYRCLS